MNYIFKSIQRKVKEQDPEEEAINMFGFLCYLLGGATIIVIDQILRIL